MPFDMANQSHPYFFQASEVKIGHNQIEPLPNIPYSSLLYPDRIRDLISAHILPRNLYSQLIDIDAKDFLRTQLGSGNGENT